jgi:hypothetical protein
MKALLDKSLKQLIRQLERAVLKLDNHRLLLKQSLLRSYRFFVSLQHVQLFG